MGTDSGTVPPQGAATVHWNRMRALILAALGLGCLAVWVNVEYARTSAARRAQIAAQAATRQAEESEREAARMSQAQKEGLLREIRTVEARVSANPADYRSRFKLAELSLQNGDFLRSLSALAVLEQQRPQDWEPPFRRSVVLRVAGKLDQALASAQRAQQLRPNDPTLAEWLGALSLQQGNPREARRWYEQALKIQPDSYAALLGKGRSMEQLVRYHQPISFPEMMAPVEKAVRLRPEDPAGLLVLSRMYYIFKKQPEEAEQLARRALSLDNRTAGPYILLAEILLSQPPTPQRLQQIGEYAYQAGVREPQNPRPPYHIGRVFLAQNDLERAIKGFERSVELQPTPEAVSQLAVVYRRAAQPEKARRYATTYQRYTDGMSRREALLRERSLHPKDPRPCLDLAELYADFASPQFAEAWLEAAAKLEPQNPQLAKTRKRLYAAAERKPDGPVLPLE